MTTEKKKVLCVTGNPCVDKIIWHHGNPRNPSRHITQIGGKGSDVARVLSNLGVDSTHLMAWNKQYDYLTEREPYKTVTVDIVNPIRVLPNYIDLNTRTTYLDYNNTNFVTAEEADKMMAEYICLVDEGQDMVVLGGSCCRGLEHIYPEMIKVAKKRGIPVLLDAHGRAFTDSVPEKPDIVSPNADELRKDFEKDSDTCIEETAERLIKVGIKTVIVTMGEEGSILMTERGLCHFPIYKVDAVNPIGSGDSFNAYFIFGYLNGAPADFCMELGAAAGAVNAASSNIAKVRPEQVKSLLKKNKKDEILRQFCELLQSKRIDISKEP